MGWGVGAGMTVSHVLSGSVGGGEGEGRGPPAI